MSIFDLLGILAVPATVVTLIVAAVAALRGRGRRALRILGVLGVCIAVYLATGLLVSLLKPQRVIAAGDPWCFDDWCLAVEHVSRTPGASDVTYGVDLRLFSRARRVSQRAKGAWIYLIDQQGHRYAPDADASAVPLDVLLGPGESVITSRVFQVPTGVWDLGLVTGHGGPYCGVMDILVIGASGCVFRKPTMVRIEVSRVAETEARAAFRRSATPRPRPPTRSRAPAPREGARRGSPGRAPPPARGAAAPPWPARRPRRRPSGRA